jgi:UDP-GlcNAc:undecaprenyl-phosphate GlcNAc-1-phosphate transferase
VNCLWRTPLDANWIIFLVTFALSLGLTPLFRKIALRSHFLDTPQGQLKKHTAPIPYMGGLAIYFSFLLGILSALILSPPSEAPRVLAMLAGGTVVAILGLTDDLFSLSPALKFLFQILAASLLILFGVQLEFLPGHPWLAKLLTIFWVVAVTNAVNLIDIMDGLAGGVSVIACMGFAFVPFLEAQSYVPMTAAALGGSVLGFLPYNYQPARIYMGDSGALFLGFILAGIAMGHGYTQVNVVALCAPLFILGIPLYDTALVMFLRFLKGRSMFRGSNDHLALRLRALGMTVKQIVWFLWGLSLLLALGAWLLVRFSEKRALFFMGSFFFVLLLFTVAVSTIQVDEGGKKLRENPFQIFLGAAPKQTRKAKRK